MRCAPRASDGPDHLGLCALQVELELTQLLGEIQSATDIVVRIPGNDDIKPLVLLQGRKGVLLAGADGRSLELPMCVHGDIHGRSITARDMALRLTVLDDQIVALGNEMASTSRNPDTLRAARTRVRELGAWPDTPIRDTVSDYSPCLRGSRAGRAATSAVTTR